MQVTLGAIEVQQAGKANELITYVGFQDQWAILKNAENDSRSTGAGG
ncbi:hypothetical protein AB0J28_01300 [Streptosporangium canum]